MWEGLHSLRWALEGNQSVLGFWRESPFLQLSCLEWQEKKESYEQCLLKLGTGEV